MNPKSNSTSSTTTGLEIVTIRLLDAPRKTVFAAFENPEHLARWWGPNGFTNTIKEFDFRPGGAWRLVMLGPDGTEYDNTAEFLEVIKPEKIVYDHLGPMHRFQMTMLFEGASNHKTKLTWRMVFERSPENEKLRQFISDANEQNFDRLAAYLEKMNGNGKTTVH